MKTKYAEVENYILNNISKGLWKPGDVLPRESELCDTLNVSRTTVRTAMANLVQQGQITRTRHKGTTVREWQKLESSTMFIESFQKELNGQNIQVVTEVLELRTVNVPENIARHLDLPENARVVKLTRLRYAKDSFEAGPVVLTTSWLPESLWPMLQECDFEHVSMRDILESHGCRRSLIEKEIVLHLLTEREARLLGESAGAPAFQVRGLSYTKANEPIEYCESTYPPARNRFLLRIRR